MFLEVCYGSIACFIPFSNDYVQDMISMGFFAMTSIATTLRAIAGVLSIQTVG